MKGFDNDSSAFLTTYHNEPYSSSLESTATTSSDSVWSAAASQSSNETSPSSSSSDSDPCDSYTLSRQSASCDQAPRFAGAWNRKATQTAQAATVPAELRQNPRRSSGNVTRCPPALVRQCDRKVNFVDNLVDSSTQIVEAIWPLSSVVCRNELGSKSFLPQRTFIQETLRRSRTSYSTLQVALYYLVLIKPHVPKHDFTMEQLDDRHECRALQCGRRMFLAALILASKYLQDRNYSARAWSKISGLGTQEINQNELAFLLAVDWELHITDEVFQRWTEIVMKYTPPSPPSPGATSALYAQQISHWKRVILTLNPQLDNVEDLIPTASLGVKSHESGHLARSVPITRRESPVHVVSGSVALAPTPITQHYSAPSTMEPAPTTVYTTTPSRHVPALGLLPTPRLTPQTAGHSTPAASAPFQLLGKGPAMGLAMAQASNVNAVQTLDRWPASLSSSPQSYFVRRSSLANSISTASSPESMISDTSRTSRSSSISSASSLGSAPSQKLGLPARFRCAKLQSERVCPRSTIPEDYEEEHMSSSPESYCGPVGKLGDLSLETPLARRERELDESDAARALQALQNYHCNGSVGPVAQPLSRKRSHPEFVGTALQDNVREMLLRSKTAWPETMVRSRFEATEEGSPRKRVCCSAEAAAGFEAVTPIGAYRGPGMWEGILN